MTAIAATITARPDTRPSPLVRTARLTGYFYLGLAVTGLVGMLFINDRLFVADDAAATLSNLVEHATLARLGVAVQLGVVATQALAALWFFRLFRDVHSFAAASITAFGMINAVGILAAAACLAAAVDVSADTSLAAAGDSAATVQLLNVLSNHLWSLSGLFFGLWLIPMGWLARRSGWMPGLLGWILMVGGAGYVASSFVAALLPDATAAVYAMTIPATVGELWMVGYLVTRGVRRTAQS